jgi:hypothetical protein
MTNQAVWKSSLDPMIHGEYGGMITSESRRKYDLMCQL